MDNKKLYDLEDRTLAFTKAVRCFIKLLPRTMANIRDADQLIRSSGSVGANYIEANEALSKKDFLMRIKICRKEAKESKYWLQIIDISGKDAEQERLKLLKESTEFVLIFAAILRKSTANIQ